MSDNNVSNIHELLHQPDTLTQYDAVTLEKEYWLKKFGVPLEVNLKVIVNEHSELHAFLNPEPEKVYFISSIGHDIEGICITISENLSSEPVSADIRIHEITLVAA